MSEAWTLSVDSKEGKPGHVETNTKLSGAVVIPLQGYVGALFLPSAGVSSSPADEGRGRVKAEVTVIGPTWTTSSWQPGWPSGPPSR